MARNPSAMKRRRQAEKARLANRHKKSMIRTFAKKAVAAAESGDMEAAGKYQRVAQKLIDKAAKTNTLHANNAARRKSRLAKRISKVTGGQQASA